MRLTSNKICISCKESFSPTSNSQKKCSTCRKCKNCDRPLRYSHRVFCSISCGAKWNYIHGIITERNLQRKGRPKVIKKSIWPKACAECNQNFYGTGAQKYCNKCPKCLFCGNRVKETNKKHCSIGCATKHRSHKNINEWIKWKENSLDRRIVVNSGEYSHWRKSVFERDNYTCQECGIKGRKLNAHHIKSWKDHEELRYSIDNGQTLCEKCHKEEHRKINKLEVNERKESIYV